MNTNKVLIIENIVDYKYNFSTRNIIVNKCYDITNNNYKKEKSYYFILDSNSNDIYFWIYESFIFINLLIELNDKYNNIKILTKINNNQILNSLLLLFNIKNEVINNIDNYNNISYSPQIYTIYYHHHKLINDDFYNKHLNYYLNHINNNLNNNFKNYTYVFIDNKNDDNDNNNDNNKYDNIINFVNKNNGIIININTNIIDNFSIINKANNIILYYNSSFYFNCMFLKNKNIYILVNNIYNPNSIYSHVSGFPFLKNLYDIIIKNNNNIKFI